LNRLPSATMYWSMVHRKEKDTQQSQLLIAFTLYVHGEESVRSTKSGVVDKDL
jgi:hypothetical protein